MNENQVKLVYEALEIIRRRSVDRNRTDIQRMSYSSAYDILCYALNENAECLTQYDDVRLYCQDCRRFYSDRADDIQLCNACEKHEFFSL